MPWKCFLDISDKTITFLTARIFFSLSKKKVLKAREKNILSLHQENTILASANFSVNESFTALSVSPLKSDKKSISIKIE